MSVLCARAFGYLVPTKLELILNFTIRGKLSIIRCDNNYSKLKYKTNILRLKLLFICPSMEICKAQILTKIIKEGMGLEGEKMITI